MSLALILAALIDPAATSEARQLRLYRPLMAAIHGCIFESVEGVRSAVTEFKHRYIRHWRLEKMDSKSPQEACKAICNPRDGLA